MKTYFIIYKTGKGSFISNNLEERVNSLDDAINILRSLYEIDKANGMHPEWTSNVAFKSTFNLPNGKETVCKGYVKSYIY